MPLALAISQTPTVPKAPALFALTSLSATPKSPSAKKCTAPAATSTAGVCAVSYTHLDVYKRQVKGGDLPAGELVEGVAEKRKSGGLLRAAGATGVDVEIEGPDGAPFGTAAGLVERDEFCELGLGAGCLLYTSRCV